jgi:hypothetical protein
MLSTLRVNYTNGHSAEVRIRLLLNGRSISVAQLGPDFIILREAESLPPCDAEMSLTIDGDEERWSIRLPEGLRTESKRVPIARI